MTYRGENGKIIVRKTSFAENGEPNGAYMKKRKAFPAGALTAPLPPAIVSVGRGEEINLLTVGWTGILATKPPKTYISVRPTRHSHALLMKYPEFVINLPSADMARAVDFVGIYTGKKMNKFERSGLTPIESTVVSAPTVAECPVAIECRVCEVVSMGSHDVFFADIVAISTHEEIIDPDGKLRFDENGEFSANNVLENTNIIRSRKF